MRRPSDDEAAGAGKHRYTNRNSRPARRALSAEQCFVRGEACFAENLMEQALQHYDRAARLGMESPLLASRRWNCLMLLGEFERAWQETDRTETIRRAAGDHNRDLPRHLRRVWNGSSLVGRSVLVRCYHGLGDTIQFVRFLPMLRQIAAAVRLQCQPRLMELFASVPGAEQIVSVEQDDPEFEVDIELMELAYAFRTTLETIPSTVPYLRISTEAVDRRRKELGRGGLKIGLVWRAGDWDITRSLSLPDLLPLFDLPGVAGYSFQHGPGVEELGSFAAHLARADRESVVDEAASILCMDLLISVDTMAAHLAGALGVPVWLLLPFSADWRWMRGNRSPWYPTMRLFRQPRPGDWAAVVRNVRSAIVSFDHGRS